MAIVVAGTGTDVGKTLASALIMARYKGTAVKYIKPVQTGEVSDRETVQGLAGLAGEALHADIYNFKTAASPHFAAELAGSEVNPHFLLSELQRRGSALVIELAGGLMVPLNRSYTNLDLIRELREPVVLVAATELGTINHSVLSHAALVQAGVENCGFIFVGKSGPLREDNIRTVLHMTGARLVGDLLLPESKLSPAALQQLAIEFDRGGALLQHLQ